MGKSKRQSRLSNQQGQALVEYVLMLVVIVAMVIAVAYQIFRPMQTFLDDYMGKYVSCLLETGELPSLGNEGTMEVLQTEGCNAKFKPATLQSGRPPADSSSGNTASSENQQNQSNASSSSKNSESSSGSGSSSSSSSSSRGRNLMTRPTMSGGADGGSGTNDKVTEIPVSVSQSKYFERRNNSGSGVYSQNRKFVMDGAMYSDEEKRKQSRKEASTQSMLLPENATAAPKKISVKPPERKIAAETEEEGMTFGNFFRILFIAAIIIALFVVLGSQALKIMKSQEK